MNLYYAILIKNQNCVHISQFWEEKTELWVCIMQFWERSQNCKEKKSELWDKTLQLPLKCFIQWLKRASAPSGHPTCRCRSLIVHEMQASGCLFLRIRKASRNTKWIPLLMPTYWGLMKQNDQSVQETKHYLLQNYL